MVVEIPLSKQGKHRGKYVAIVDDIDKDLAELNWCLINFRYAQRQNAEGKKVSMHCVILERVLGHSLKKGQIVDHCNGNGLDNRRENLRLATVSQNNINTGKRKDNKSGFKGVCWSKSMKKWEAQIAFQGTHERLGFFDTPEEAHEAYKKRAVELYGEFARFDSFSLSEGG